MSWKDKYDYVRNFKNGFAKVRKIINDEYKYGYVNTKGEEIIPCMYDFVYDFENGFAIVRQTIDYENKWGVVNTKGKEIISCVCDDLEYLSQAFNEYEKKNSLEKFLQE